MHTITEGTVAGLGLAIALVNPKAENWPMSDGGAVMMSVAAGVAGALGARAASANLDPEAPRRPRLRMAGGVGSRSDMAYSLAYRVPVRSRWDLEGAIVVESEEWERSAVETRCSPLFGCITGSFLVDHRYLQNMAAMMRGVYHVVEGRGGSGTLSIGAGPVRSHREAEGEGPSGHTALALDAGLGVEVGGRGRWTVDLVGNVVAPRRAGHPEGGITLRVGRAFGYR